MQEVLTHIIDALNVHLKYYERSSKTGRGFIISKLFSCLLDWIMSIDPIILTETDLCQLVFDVIELAIHLSSVRILFIFSYIRSITIIKQKRMAMKNYYHILLDQLAQAQRKKKLHSSLN